MNNCIKNLKMGSALSAIAIVAVPAVAFAQDNAASSEGGIITRTVSPDHA